MYSRRRDPKGAPDATDQYTCIEIHEPERERPSWAAEGWSDGEIEEDKSHGVEKHWPASPHEGKTTRIEAGRSLRC